MKTKCIMLNIYHQCRLISSIPYPYSNETHTGIKASLEIARQAMRNLEEFVYCNAPDSEVHCSLGFGEVTK